MCHYNEAAAARAKTEHMSTATASRCVYVCRTSEPLNRRVCRASQCVVTTESACDCLGEAGTRALPAAGSQGQCVRVITVTISYTRTQKQGSGQSGCPELGVQGEPPGTTTNTQDKQVSADTHTHTHAKTQVHTHTHTYGHAHVRYTCLVAALQLYEIPLASRKHERNKGSRPMAARLGK